MDNQSYWARRQLEREAQWHDLTTEELRKLKRYYVKAAADIERDIAALYAKYATENGLTMTAARKLIRGDEFKSWRLTLEEYVRASKVDPKILRELNTLTARSRISRLEALHARTLMETIDLAERLQEAADAHLARAYLETYYGNLYDFHKTIGLSTPPNAVDAKRVESVLQTAWVGKNYSSRIWANQAKLANELEATMLQAIHRGSSIQQLSKALSRRMDVAYSNAERLIRTELNAVENRASAAAMKAAEFTHYQFMATLDRRTCARCGERDGEVYKLSEMNQGENAPPLHARCRCTIVAYDGFQYGTRAARDDDGKYQRIPADMSYRDWKAVYIDKSKTFETWRAEFDARRQADEQSPLRQRGRQVIEDLAAGRDPRAPKPSAPPRNYKSQIAKKLGKPDYEHIRGIVESSTHTKAAQVWYKFEDRVQIEWLRKKEGYQWGDKIFLQRRYMREGHRGMLPYEMLFHESGHLIDCLASENPGGKQVGKYFARRYKAGAFVNAVKADFNALIATKRQQLQEEIAARISAGDRRWLYDNEFCSYDVLKGAPIPKKIKVDDDDCLRFLKTDWEAAHTMMERGNFSDVVNGQTYGDLSLGTGHPRNYWLNGGSDYQSAEAFAEFFSAAIAHPASYAILQKYLPTAERIFNEILDEILKAV